MRGLADAALEIDGESLPTELGKVVFQLWLQRHAAAATAFFDSAGSENDPIDASELTPILARAKALSDPKAAIEWIDQLPESMRDVAFESAFAAMADASPAEAARWWSSLADADARPSIAELIAQRVMDIWPRYDPATAAEWLVRLSEGPTRDAAVGSFSNALVHLDLEASAEWASTIASDEVRQTTMTSALHHWRASDSEAAEAWIQQSQRLTADEREWLQSIAAREVIRRGLKSGTGNAIDALRPNPKGNQ